MHHADTATAPTGPLLEAIIRDFGSFETCKQQLTQIATTWFGSGWGWLCIDANNKLLITGTANQNCPLSDKLYPLLTIDIWEHAYYIQYQNRRADFVQSWWSLVNWQFVQERYNSPFAR
jgi:Fe-Mn family superoxide dismutase